MKLSDFDYHLPKELIAQYPLKERDTCRLLVLDRKKRTIEHRIFKDIIDYFCKGDLLVLNDTKVLPCRLNGKRQTGGKVEVLLLNQKKNLVFEALIRPARLKIKERIIFTPLETTKRQNKNKMSLTGFNGVKLYGELTAKNEITFYAPDINTVYRQGSLPLPPYIKRDSEDTDNIYYQTVYAQKEGSIASPTAGLHFTQELINTIKSNQVNIAYITLHISYSTFKPVKALDVVSHKMEKEYYCINKEAGELLKMASTNKGRVFSVGTTSLRALEAYALTGMSEAGTDLFIYPGYKFKTVNGLLTNFHLPRTTLFMLACAFAEEALIKKAYQEAINKQYRFYSYGDAMLII